MAANETFLSEGTEGVLLVAEIEPADVAWVLAVGGRSGSTFFPSFRGGMGGDSVAVTILWTPEWYG